MIEKEIKVSIIIPVYNVEKYIELCIKSILKQDYDGIIECIIVDDCGSDNSINIAKSLICKTSAKFDIKIIKHNKNMGLSAARNTGIKAATGDYLFFLDSDDYIKDDAIKTLVAPIIKYGYLDLVVGNTYPTKQKGLEWMDLSKKELPNFSNDRIWIKQKLLERFTLSMTACNKLIRRNLIIENNLYFMEGIIHEDDHWNFYLAKYVKSISIVKDYTYVYNIRENSITQKYDSEKDDKTYLRICKNWIDNVDDLCRKEQIRLVASFLIPIFLFSRNVELKKTANYLLQLLALKRNKALNILVIIVNHLNTNCILKLRINYILTKCFYI